MLNILLLPLGIFGLWLSSSILVSLLEKISHRYQWSMVGLASIVLATLTSLPELMVSVISVYEGQAELALGNLFGSYVANICLVIGLCAMIVPIKIQEIVFQFKIPMLFILIIVTCLIPFVHSIVLSMVMLGAYFTYMKLSMDMGEHVGDVEDEFPLLNRVPILPMFILACVVLFFSTEAVIDSAILLAKLMGVSEYWIGLTVVAIGTSLPELVTSIMAQKKGMGHVIVAQVVGSNVFMFFFVMPVILLMGMDTQVINFQQELLFLLLITLVVLSIECMI